MQAAHTEPLASAVSLQGTVGEQLVPCKPSLLVELGVSGVAVATATTCTNPVDVVKTRLQLQLLKGASQAGVSGAVKEGMVKTAIGIVRHEGLFALWSGLPPALARGVLYGGLRLGLYNPIKSVLSADVSRPAQTGESSSSHTQQPALSSTQQLSFGAKLLAGSAAGGFAALLTSPTELIKTRLQAQGNVHKSSMAVMQHVIRQDGIHGLWKGAIPGIVRAGLLNASQCATYDEVKRSVMATTGWGDCVSTQLTCSLITGLVTTTVTNPADVIKTVMYVSGGRYSGPLAALSDILAKQGPSALMRGWLANYTRLGPQTTIAFLVAEQLRSMAGLPRL